MNPRTPFLLALCAAVWLWGHGNRRDAEWAGTAQRFCYSAYYRQSAQLAVIEREVSYYARTWAFLERWFAVSPGDTSLTEDAP